MQLDELIQQAWADHAEETAAVADRLAAGLDLVEDDAGAARYMSLVNHTVGDHLGERARATTLCEAVVKHLGEAAGPNAYLHLAVARRLSGDAAGADAAAQAAGGDDPAVPVRIGLLVAQGHMHAGGWDEAERVYRAMLSSADGMEPGHGAERAAAVVSNNVASELLGLEARSDAQDALMRDAAQAAFTYWSRIGTWVNEERGDYLLSSVHLALGEAATAREHAERGLHTIRMADGEQPVDEAFLHLARAAACRDLGDADEQRASLRSATTLAEAFEDQGLVSWFEDELAKAR